MSLGAQWNEIGLPYDSPANDEIGMEMAPDRYRFISSARSSGRRAGGGATAAARPRCSRVSSRGAGRSLPDYARAALFDPMGLGRTEWITSKETWVARQFGGGDGDGEPIAASGLRMTPRDLARIGQLVLDHGRSMAVRSSRPAWLAECFTPRVSVNELRRYGYQWYLGDLEFRAGGTVRLEHWVGAAGNGGQRLYVMPELDLAVVVTAGNYICRAMASADPGDA